MKRLDHCFLLAAKGGDRGMAFCRGGDREEAREKVVSTLGREKGHESYDLAYLGLLDYREMETPAEAMLEPFERFDPVWLVFFR